MTTRRSGARLRGAASTGAALHGRSPRGVVTASGAETTTLKVEGSFNVTGPLETFANAGGVHLARALLAEFAANMARVAGEREPERPGLAPAPQAPPISAAAAAPAAELRGGVLIWRAFLGWLKQIFSARQQSRGSR
jgi:uncharacterized protein